MKKAILLACMLMFGLFLTSDLNRLYAQGLGTSWSSVGYTFA